MTQRRFVLARDVDETGISGTGIVVEGVQYSDGHVAYRWMSQWPTDQQAENMAIVERVHGHRGKTRIVWLDPEEE
jgi:hypothetical protein